MHSVLRENRGIVAKNIARPDPATCPTSSSLYSTAPVCTCLLSLSSPTTSSSYPHLCFLALPTTLKQQEPSGTLRVEYHATEICLTVSSSTPNRPTTNPRLRPRRPGRRCTFSSVWLTRFADGRKERVQFDKITARVSRLCYGLDPDHVDPAAITMKTISGVYQGVTTIQLDDLAAETAAYMTVTHPDYAILAARIA
ncbi:hypothetical protein D0866_11140, partial [Hortaea werneckii]